VLRSLLGALVLAGAILFSPEAEGALPPDYSGRFLWSTFIGGDAEDSAADVAQSASGDIFVVGSVDSPSGLSLPANTVRVGPRGMRDVVVLKFSAEGVAQWAVVFGGSKHDKGASLVLGPAGEVFVAGYTESTDFTVPRPDGSPGTRGYGSLDAFVARVNPEGRGLDWFVHVGGSDLDTAQDMTLAEGALFIAGFTYSSNMVGGGGPASGTDGFVTRFDPSTLQVQWTELISGGGQDVVLAVAAQAGRIVVAGHTDSWLLEGYVNNYRGGDSDGFLSVLDPTTHQVLKTLYVGGDRGDGVSALTAFEQQGEPYVAVVGNSWSYDFLGTSRGLSDAFVALYDVRPESSTELPLRGGMRLGGAGEEFGYDVTWGGPSFPDDLYVAGMTSSSDFPLVGALDWQLEGSHEGFVAKLSLGSIQPGAWPSWSTFVGQEGLDGINALSFSAQERLVVAGLTRSSQLPGGLPGFDSTPSSQGDMLLASMDLSIGWQPSDGGTQDGGEPWDGGWDGGLPDASWPEPKPGDGGTGPIIKPPDLGLGGGSPLGWSCGCTSFQGPGTLALGALLALGLRASRRRRQGSARPARS